MIGCTHTHNVTLPTRYMALNQAARRDPTRTTSLRLRFVRQMNKASNFDNPSQYTIPGNRRTIAHYVMDHGKPKDMVPYITDDRSFTRIFIRTDIAASNDIAAFNP